MTINYSECRQNKLSFYRVHVTERIKPLARSVAGNERRDAPRTKTIPIDSFAHIYANHDFFILCKTMRHFRSIPSIFSTQFETHINGQVKAFTRPRGTCDTDIAALIINNSRARYRPSVRVTVVLDIDLHGRAIKYS